jgi:hypothetical protein
MADLKNVNIGVIKYLDDKGLQALWNKISDTYLRDSEVLDALTTYGTGKIITEADKVFIQKYSLDEVDQRLTERIEDVAAAQGTNIDNDTIVNKEGKLQTNLLLSNDKDNHILRIVTGAEDGKGTVVSQWDYTEFYNEAVKDGILDNVSLVVVPTDETTEASSQEPGTYLKFVFNTASGKQPLYVNVTDLIDVYTGSSYIQVDKKNGSSEISIKTTELVNYLKTDDALGITTIVTKIEDIEDEIASVKKTISDLQQAWDSLNIQEIIERIQTNEENIQSIFTILETVPNTPITDEEIDALV